MDFLEFVWAVLGSLVSILDGNQPQD